MRKSKSPKKKMILSSSESDVSDFPKRNSKSPNKRDVSNSESDLFESPKKRPKKGKESDDDLVESIQEESEGRMDLDSDTEHQTKSNENLLSPVLCDSDEEMWTLQIPSTLNINELLQKEVDMTDSNTTELESKFKFQPILADNCQNIVSLPPSDGSNKVSVTQSRGHIIVHESHNTNDDWNELKFIEREVITFPTNIKERHPLLGANWVEHLNLAKKAIKHSKRMISEEDGSSKKKKKRKTGSI